MLDPIFRISQITLPVATVLGTAWVLVSGRSGESAFLFFIGGMILTIVLRIMEQEIFADNISHGRYWKSHY